MRSQRLSGLSAELVEVGAPADLMFLYSVFEDSRDMRTKIIYRGRMAEPPQLKELEKWAFFAFADIPWTKLASYETEMTLRRFADEYTLDRFGIFAETSSGGRLAELSVTPEIYDRTEAERRLKSS